VVNIVDGRRAAAHVSVIARTHTSPLCSPALSMLGASPMKKHVLVTGANGHVGYNLVKELLAHGYRVRASVRDVAKSKHLKELGDVELVSADIMKPETLEPAMEGLDGVFQVAAVFAFHAKDPEKEIIAPSVVGGENVLRAAAKAKVKKVVFTSSTMAVGTHTDDGRALDESDWNDAAKDPYMIAKTRGERTAWKVAEETGLDLVVMNPTSVIGPGFYRHTPSTIMFEALLRKWVPLLPAFFFSHADARDVAVGHRLAYENEKAKGKRYILADEHVTMRQLVDVVARVEPTLKVPKTTIPSAFMPAAVLFDALLHKVAGRPRMLTSEMVAELGGKEQRVSSERARKELGWKPRAYEDSVADTMKWVREHFMS
jgi:dihydroflavonol-4-reductase